MTAQSKYDDVGFLEIMLVGGRPVITGADPRVCITDDLFTKLPWPYGAERPGPGDVLNLIADNRTVAYRIIDVDRDAGQYLAEWVL